MFIPLKMVLIGIDPLIHTHIDPSPRHGRSSIRSHPLHRGRQELAASREAKEAQAAAAQALREACEVKSAQQVGCQGAMAGHGHVGYV